MAPPKCKLDFFDFESHDLALIKLEKDAEYHDGSGNFPAVGNVCLPESTEVRNGVQNHSKRFLSQKSVYGNICAKIKQIPKYALSIL